MADELLTFESMNDDEEGCLSEGEYDALNDETFGGDGTELDWEEQHEQLANITESSRRHNDHLDLEASLCRLVLDEEVPQKAPAWPVPPQLSLSKPPPAAAPVIQPNTMPFKKVCTVEELERQMRNAPPQQNYFQPRFPVILQRPPGLPGPVPLPFNPGMQMNNQNINQMIQNNQLGPIGSGNLMGPGNQIGPNQMINPSQMLSNQMGINNQMQQNLLHNMQMGPNNHIGPSHQMMTNNQINPTQMGPGNQMGPNHQMMNGNQFGLAQLSQMSMIPPPHLIGQRMIAPQNMNNMQRPNMPSQPFNHNFRHPMEQQLMNNQMNQSQNQPFNHTTQVPQQMFNHQSQSGQNQLTGQTANSSQISSQNAMGSRSDAKPTQTRIYNNSSLTSQNLVQLIRNTHPMLAHNSNRTHGMGYNQVNRYTDGHSDDEDAEPGDEYAGLMSQREKQWLLNIQLLQLNTGTPYTEDYYYTVWQERQARKKREGVKEAHKANQQNHPFYSGGKQETRERHRHNSTSEEQPTPRTYVPTQFENSLGKLQCGSVTAPRKIIDVEVVREETTGRPSRAPSVASTAPHHEGPRETRRAKQTLLELEGLYLALLRLEELNDPLAIANALVLKEREEKARQAEAARAEEADTYNVFLRNIESVQRRASDDKDKRQVVSLKPAAEPLKQRNLLDESKSELLGRLFAGLLAEDRLPAFLAVRKGKILVRRFLARATPPHPRLRALWARLLRALPAAARRDRDDRLLPGLTPHCRRYVSSTSGWAAVLECSAHLAETLDPARPPHALLTPLTLNVVGILLEKAATLIGTSEASPSERQWTKFLKNLARTLKTCTSITVARPTEPLQPNEVRNHIKLLESKATVEILQRGKPDCVDLAKNELSDLLVKHLC